MDYRIYKHSWVYSQSPLSEKELSQEEIANLLSKGGWMVRNCHGFNEEEQSQFWHVIKDSFHGMEELTSRVRNKIRKAERLLEIRLTDKETIKSEGYEVHIKALRNYKVKSRIPSREDFSSRIDDQGDDYEYWGCFDKENGKLIAFSINKIFPDCCYYETFKASPDYLRGYYPFYGLIHHMNQYYLEEKKLDYVYDGARSLTEHSNVQPFLMETFNFKKIYSKVTIHYASWMNPFIKILYPFKKYIPKSAILSLLNMEAMSRNEYDEPER